MDKEFLEKIEKIHKMIVSLKNNNKDFFTNLSLEMKIDVSGFGNVLTKMPSENSVKLFIIDFRPFLLQGEYAHIPSLCNKICKELNIIDSTVCDKVNNFKNDWNNFLNGTNIGGVATKINNKQIQVKEKIDLWLNGKFIHPTDTKDNKHEKLTSIDTPPFGPMDYYFFLDVLQRLAFLLFFFDEKILAKIIAKS